MGRGRKVLGRGRKVLGRGRLGTRARQLLRPCASARCQRWNRLVWVTCKGYVPRPYLPGGDQLYVLRGDQGLVTHASTKCEYQGPVTHASS